MNLPCPRSSEVLALSSRSWMHCLKAGSNVIMAFWVCSRPRVLRRSFRAGERIFMAHSLKFDEARIHAFAAEAGMASSRSWLDDMYLLVELRPRLPRVEL